jgi:hypothetical protein
LVSKILGLLNQEGIKYNEELKKELQEAIDNNCFHFIRRGEKDAAFFTWIVTKKREQLFIYINNFFTIGEFKGKINFLQIRKFMREKYPNGIYYFHRDKTNKFYYTR